MNKLNPRLTSDAIPRAGVPSYLAHRSTTVSKEKCILPILGGTETKDFAEALGNNSSIRELQIDFDTFHLESRMRLVQQICTNKTIQLLRLSINNVYLDCSAEIARIIEGNSTIKSLNVTWTSDNTALPPIDGVLLGRALEKNKTLMRLELIKSDITSEHALKILTSAATNESLIEIVFDGNKIDDSGAFEIADIIRKNPRIKILNLSNSQINETGIVALTKALVSNNNLVRMHIDFWRCKEKLHEVRVAVEGNTKILGIADVSCWESMQDNHVVQNGCYYLDQEKKDMHEITGFLSRNFELLQPVRKENMAYAYGGVVGVLTGVTHNLTGCIDYLPAEILASVVERLSIEDGMNAAITNRQAYAIATRHKGFDMTPIKHCKTELLLRAYFHGKDENRPYLFEKVFCEAATLNMQVKGNAIAFPEMTHGRAAITEQLVEKFNNTYQHIKTFCLQRPTSDSDSGQFDCDWLVVMSAREDGTARIGCGSYHWDLQTVTPFLVKHLQIKIEVMKVFPSKSLQQILHWSNELSYPWCSNETIAATMPLLEGIEAVSAYLSRKQ